ncbi:MAG: hypothetical protein TREMPRED_000717 [Tremellales sp. Tagirdzhanova-0007]|nr:MAG: hypothetical protein TREMPRED_000717 [Tremellales sp. Tagirdzhanova-0007]
MSKLTTPFNSPQLLLARLNGLTSTLPGLDASLMLAQYSSPIVITLLLSLARLRAASSRTNTKAAGGAGLIALAEGWGNAAASIGDARVIMRAAGLLPIIQYLFALHPRPLASLASLLNVTHILTYFNGPKTLPTLQIVSLLCYYPLEHLAWLGSKGVIPLSVRGIGIAQLLSVRFWALYVLLEIYKLRNTYLSLNTRTRSMRAAKAKVSSSEAEGYELQDSSTSVGAKATTSTEIQGEELRSLMKSWTEWKNAVIVNSGYAPLTIHWSTIGGLWTNPLITAVFGSVAASEDVASFGDLPDGVAICINTDPHAPLCHHESMKSTSSLADVSGPALHRGNGSAEQPRKTDRQLLSPLFANGYPDRAQIVLERYHGSGLLTPVVELDLLQTKASVQTKPRRWDYAALVQTREARYRFMLALMIGMFGQLSGTGLTNFVCALSAGLSTYWGFLNYRGCTNKLVMTMVAYLASLLGASIGTWHTERLGRRKVLIFGSFACAVALACAMTCSASSHGNPDGSDAGLDHVASRGAIAFLIVFASVYSWGYQPLLGLYPSEVLSMKQRSTGLGCMVLASKMATLQKIGWWTYLPFVCWDLVETASWYFLAIETKGHTLEELDEIFDATDPVLASLNLSRLLPL